MARPFEFYETPPGVTAALLTNEAMDTALGPRGRPITVLDPCAGEGAILSVVKSFWPEATILGNDLAPRGWPLQEDATTYDGWSRMLQQWDRPEWVITNPPWSLAHKILPHALGVAKVGVALHLPLRFQEPTQARAEVLRKHPWTFQITLGQPRPSYTEDGGTDSATSFWAVWVPQWGHMSLYYVTDPASRWRSTAQWRLGWET